MARGELMKKLLASYGQDQEFRAVAEQIIGEEERKKNRVLARSLRKTLDNIQGSQGKSNGGSPLIPFPDAAKDFIERIEPERRSQDIVLSSSNFRILAELITEFRHSEDIRSHGLPVRSKLLFCGPPGCGKTLCAEVFAAELGLPLFIVRLDSLISSYLGETASNIRKIFEFARRQPCVLFLDEFDALARSRSDNNDHSELRRVVNSLLIFIDRIQPSGFLVAATNLDKALDPAIWRRFDEVIWLDKPDRLMVSKFLNHKFKNIQTSFEPSSFMDKLEGYSFAEIEQICVQAIKSAVIKRKKVVEENDFRRALLDSIRRRTGSQRLSSSS